MKNHAEIIGITGFILPILIVAFGAIIYVKTYHKLLKCLLEAYASEGMSKLDQDAIKKSRWAAFRVQNYDTDSIKQIKVKLRSRADAARVKVIYYFVAGVVAKFIMVAFF